MTRLLTCIVVLTLVLITDASASEYHTFTNQDGKTIVARIVEYDSDSGKVRLELKNRKTAWVDTSTLSEEDQTYINQWSEGESVNSTVQTEEIEPPISISKGEVGKIAKLYVQALREKNFELIKPLISTNANLTIEQAEKNFNRMTIVGRDEDNCPDRRSFKGDDVSIGSIDGLNAELTISHRYYEDDHGWLQLLPDGTIKYDLIISKHPFVDLEEGLGWLTMGVRAKSKTNTWTSQGLRILKKYDVPGFGFNKGTDKQDREKVIEQIVDWVLEKEKDWDVSEPKLELPKQRYRVMKNRLKSL